MFVLHFYLKNERGSSLLAIHFLENDFVSRLARGRCFVWVGFFLVSIDLILCVALKNNFIDAVQ